jgi:hypothetical protein
MMPDILTVIVPPLAVGGDMEDVQIIFRCDLSKRRVEATNQCM